MSKVAIIGVGQSTFVRSYPGSIRELAFEGFKDGGCSNYDQRYRRVRYLFGP